MLLIHDVMNDINTILLEIMCGSRVTLQQLVRGNTNTWILPQVLVNFLIKFLKGKYAQGIITKWITFQFKELWKARLDHIQYQFFLS